MLRLRSLLAIALSCVLVLTGGAMAAARGQAGPAGQMVICSGGAVVMVAMDADGKPVGPVHICPDCALTLLAAVVPPDMVPVPAPAAARIAFERAETIAGSASLIHARARAPPVG